jgi:hypothetical protein
MTKFIVHLYREMKLSYAGIEADTPHAAAEMVSKKLTAADNIEDCEGQNLAALVDVAGDEDYSQSVTIDFEPERIRKAAAKLLAALETASNCMAYDPDEGDATEMRVFGQIRTAIAEANAVGISPVPGEPDVHAYLAERRKIAVIWAIEDVQEIRPGVTDDQVWEVLQNVHHYKDAEQGICWLTLEMAADDLFGSAPETDEAKEV